MAFLDRHAGAKAFLWTTPLGELGLFTRKNPAPTPMGGGVFKLTVTIKLFKQRWTLSDDGEMIPGRGSPIDVPLNSWVDVRLDMPRQKALSADATIA